MLISPFQALQAGKFISRGKSRHETRKISTWELIFVLRGTLDMFEGSKQFHLKSGDRLLLRPNTRHGGSSDYASDLMFYWLHFAPRTSEAVSILKTLPPRDTVSNPLRLADAIQFYLSRREDTPSDQGALDIIFELIMYELSHVSVHDELPISPKDSPLVREAKRYIQIHFYENIRTSDIANFLQCNPDYLGKLFHEAYGKTITEAIHERRISTARRYLIDSPLSIKEIAQHVGFSDIVHFRRCFFASQGMTPRQFRSLHAPGCANTE